MATPAATYPRGVAPARTKTGLFRRRNGANGPIDCSGCACFTLVLFAVVAVIAIIIAAVAIGYATRNTSTTVHLASGEIPTSPFGNHLDGGGAALAMTLPNDLSAYTGALIHIYALDAQAHTVTIAAGALTSTWDGTNTVATFGGAIGDGLTFRVIAPNRAVVVSSTGVAFS